MIQSIASAKGSLAIFCFTRLAESLDKGREVYHLLLVQDLCLSWGKEERSSAYAKKRAEFPIAYSLDKLPDTFHGDVIVHRLGFWQRGSMFRTLRVSDAYRFQFYTSVEDLNLTNLSIWLRPQQTWRIWLSRFPKGRQ